MSFFKEVKINTDNSTGDAFGRVRVSTPKTLFDAKQLSDNAPLFWEDVQISGSGTTSTYSSDRASSVIAVTNVTAGRRVRQTYQRFNYQPGKSTLILMTGILNKSGGGSGIIRRMGYYDDNNGVFLQDSSGTYSVVRRTHVSGSPVDTVVSQASWNIDTLDGNGDSGITIDLTKTNILVIDLEWLGVGRVRFGFNIDGITYYFHQFLNANSLDSVYMSTPNLPLRYEIINSGTGIASEFECICTSVISEGDLDPLGINRYASTAGTHVDANVENIIYAILGIRLKSNYLSTTINIKNISLFVATADSLEWMLIFNPTVAGVFTYVDETNSAVQIARGALANTVTGGIQFDGGHINTVGSRSEKTDIDSILKLGSSVAGVQDTIVLAVRPIDGSINIDVEGSICWRELL